MAALGKTRQDNLGRTPWWGTGAGDVMARRWGLVGLCVGLNLLEATLVAAFGHGTHPDLAPQASAIAPFGVFGDLRWVSVYHDSWPSVSAELLGTLVVRGLLTALSIGLAWPLKVARPARPTLVRRGLMATGLAAVLLMPSVTLLFGIAVVPVSWLFLAAVPTALLVAFIVHPAAVSADWWRRLVSARAVGWVAGSFVTLSVASALMAASPAALWPVIATLVGAFNAWSWVGLVHTVVERRPARHIVPFPGLAALGLAGIVIGGTVLGFSMTQGPSVGRAGGPASAGTSGRAAAPPNATPARPSAARHQKGPALLIVSGYGSRWDGLPDDPIPGGYIEERFSYKGLALDGLPLAYTSADTAKPLARLDRMLLAQVAALHRRTHRDVDVIAESEGALVSKTALLARPDPAVKLLVMASPLESPGRVSYPTGGADGWGVASNAAMQLISDAVQGVAPINLSPDNPLFASMDHEAPVLENAVSCPLAGARQYALLPLADATVTPATGQLPFPSVVLAAFHGGLLETPSGQDVVADILEHRPLAKDPLLKLADVAISYAATAWQVPSLTPSDYPSTSAKSQTAGPGPGCTQVARELARQIYGAGA